MAAAAHGNGHDPERVKQCVDRIEAIERERERHHMTYMGECSKLAEDRKAVYEEAKSAWGIPKRALKSVIKVRSLERKVEKARDDLEADDRESFDQIRFALGDLADTPLGRAASGEGDDEGDLRGTEQKERDGVRKDTARRQQGKASASALNAAAGGETNAERLQNGIKPLHS